MPDMIVKKDGVDYPVGVIPQSLYDTIAELSEDSGWNTLSGYTKYRKIGSVVTLGVNILDDFNAGYNTIGTLPEGYRPSITIYGFVGYESANTVWTLELLRIGTDGTVKVYTPALSSIHLYGAITFLV